MTGLSLTPAQAEWQASVALAMRPDDLHRLIFVLLAEPQAAARFVRLQNEILSEGRES